jgi:hypothetical protein
MNQQQTIELLPLYLNDRLDLFDKEQVKAATDEDEVLQHELTFLQLLKHQIRCESITSPGEMGWARLKRDIDAMEDRSQQQSSLRKTTYFSSWWKTAAVAASLVLVIQTGVLIQQQSSPTESYRPLSSNQLETTVNVKFDSGVSESQLRQLIVELEGSIVEGPSAKGIYQIRFKNPQDAIEKLNANGLVELANATLQLENTVQVKFNEGITEYQLRQLLTELEGRIVKGPSAIGIYHIRFDQQQSAIQWLNASGLVDYAEMADE